MKKPKFVPDQTDPRWCKLVADICRVWQEIGPDCEQACEESGEPMTGEIRLEVCLDADRLTYGGAADSSKFYDQLVNVYGWGKVDRALVVACGL